LKQTFLFKNNIFKCFLLIFFFFFVCLNSCTAQLISDEFYLGLAGLSVNEKIPESIKLLEKSLKNPNMYIRQAAADELACLISGGIEIPAKTIKLVRKEVSYWWYTAFDIVLKLDKQKALEFLLKFDQTAPKETRNYVYGECVEQEIILTDKELAAIEGHFAVLNLKYNDALMFFRNFQEDGIWPQNVPLIFLQFPELISDLGKAFQYTSFGMEGLSLFSLWENNLTDTTSLDISDDVKYRFNFFKARIARRNGLNTQAISFFEQALCLAPDTEQSQACIWYILDISSKINSSFFIRQLEKLISQWDKGNYFNDVLENILQVFVSKKEWKNIIHVFSLIKDSNASIRAAYAWVIARGIEEELITIDEKTFALEIVQIENGRPFDYMQIAYNAAENDTGSFFYYRSISAHALEKPAIGNLSYAEKSRNLSPAGQFLFGFFIHNVPQYSMRYIRQFENELSVDELRVIAEAFEKEGMYIQSIQLVIRYMERKEHSFDIIDLELLFPRPFIGLVETFAAETGIAPHILYGLIRTESAFQTDVISSAGAVGLMQIMPETGMEMAVRIKRAGGPDYIDTDNNLDLSNPVLNIHIGAYYLKYLSDRFEDILLSLLAYNGGMNRIRRLKAASTLPVDLFLETISINETRDYGRKVIAAAAMYEYLYYNQHQK
jgi:soluble lytic murein transglycosylase